MKYIGKYDTSCDRETGMIATRWKYFIFAHQILVHEAKQLPPCPHCFSVLTMAGLQQD